jgi:hypothetical protein
MARAWSLDGPHLTLWAEGGAGPPLPIQQRISSGEHAAVLETPDQFDSLHRKHDFLAEGVHTVFGIKDGEADPQGLYFQANLFTPAEARQWLQNEGWSRWCLRRRPKERHGAILATAAVDKALKLKGMAHECC